MSRTRDASLPAVDAFLASAVPEIFARLGTNAEGLRSTEAAKRLAAEGANEPPAPPSYGLARLLVGRLTSPLVAILIVASIASAALGEPINALIIVGILLLSVTLELIQTERSQRAANALRSQIAPTAHVLRDGMYREIPRREIVRGDLVRLDAGDMVPADAILLEAKDLHVQQAALTGESMPVEKDPHRDRAPPANPAEARHVVCLGSSVVSGYGVAVVVATGANTTFGEVVASLAARPAPTEFERGIERFGKFILETVLFLVLFVFVVAAAFHRPALESLLFAVALAVGLTPEFLPMITTVTLAKGAVRMARQKVIVKHLEAIQNFGSIDILCSDKTGTLTRGEMELAAHVDASGAASNDVLSFAHLNSHFESGVGNPLDLAILRLVAASPVDATASRHSSADIARYTKIDEVPFDFESRRVSVVVQSEGVRTLVVKGAPESILPACVARELDGREAPLDSDARAQATTTFEALSSSGYRVLAVAYRSVPEQPAYRRDDERDLVLTGFLAFVDPPLEGAKEAVEALALDGVDVKILTGDNDLVARHVCESVGIDPGAIVVGSQLESISDPALATLAARTRVFARVSPMQKNRIISVLRGAGHVVGYMGDGINDAPSLHSADVGISVATAVDVAKEASDIILLERNLSVLHAGILEGRRAFGNVMKYLLMGTSSNFGNMFSMAGASLVLPFLPMLPTQILLNNFLYDLAQVTIPTDHVDESFVRKPHRWDIGLIRRFMVVIGPISSIYDFLTFGVLMVMLHANEPTFHTGWFVESLATQTLVIFIIRTAGNPFRSRPSPALAATTLLVVAAGIVLPFTSIGSLLGFVPLPATFFVFLVAATSTYLVLVEIVKRRLFRRLFV